MSTPVNHAVEHRTGWVAIKEQCGAAATATAWGPDVTLSPCRHGTRRFLVRAEPTEPKSAPDGQPQGTTAQGAGEAPGSACKEGKKQNRGRNKRGRNDMGLGVSGAAVVRARCRRAAEGAGSRR